MKRLIAPVLLSALMASPVHALRVEAPNASSVNDELTAGLEERPDTMGSNQLKEPWPIAEPLTKKPYRRVIVGPTALHAAPFLLFAYDQKHHGDMLKILVWNDQHRAEVVRKIQQDGLDARLPKDQWQSWLIPLQLSNPNSNNAKDRYQAVVFSIVHALSQSAPLKGEPILLIRGITEPKISMRWVRSLDVPAVSILVKQQRFLREMLKGYGVSVAHDELETVRRIFERQKQYLELFENL